MSRTVPTRSARSILPTFVTLLALTACATHRPSTLPRTWDDEYLEAIKSGRPDPKPRLAVLPFAVSDRVSDATDLRIGDILTTALFETGRFDLIERDQLSAVLEEQDLAKKGVVDPETAASVGKIVGADAVVFGNLSSATQQRIDRFAYDQIVTEVRIDARAADVTTGRLIFAEAAKGVSEFNIITDSKGTIITGSNEATAQFATAAAHATEALGDKLAARFPLIGCVVSRHGQLLITDLGADKRLVVGDRLIVFRPLERTLHPRTGKAVWTKLLLGSAVVDSLEGSSSQATWQPSKDSRGTVDVGDLVVLNRD